MVRSSTSEQKLRRFLQQTELLEDPAWEKHKPKASASPGSSAWLDPFLHGDSAAFASWSLRWAWVIQTEKTNKKMENTFFWICSLKPWCREILLVGGFQFSMICWSLSRCLRMDLVC